MQLLPLGAAVCLSLAGALHEQLLLHLPAFLGHALVPAPVSTRIRHCLCRCSLETILAVVRLCLAGLWQSPEISVLICRQSAFQALGVSVA